MITSYFSDYVIKVSKYSQDINFRFSVYFFTNIYSNSRLMFLSKISQNVTEYVCTPLQYSCLENPMDEGAWQASVHGVARSRTRLSDFTFTFHFHALEKEMATHSSVLPWRIPGTGEPGGLPSMGSHRVGHDGSDLARLPHSKTFLVAVLFEMAIPNSIIPILGTFYYIQLTVNSL